MTLLSNGEALTHRDIRSLLIDRFILHTLPELVYS